MNREVLNDLIVVKRSGQRVTFNGTKIAIAIKSAFDDVYETYDESKVNFVYNKVIETITEKYENRKTINVEDIQDIIENNLKKHNFNEVYDAFYTYRLKRKASRETFQIRKEHKFVKVLEHINNTFEEQKIGKPLDQLVTYGKTISNEFARNYLIDNKYIRLCDDGTIYIHNLDMQGNATIDSYNIDLTAIDANNINEYTNRLLDILINIKTDIYGYINIPNLDILYSKIIIKDFSFKLNNTINDYLELEGFNEFINNRKIEELIDKIDTINIDYHYFASIASSTRFQELINNAINNSLKYLTNDLKQNLYYLINTLNNIKTYLKSNLYSISISNISSHESKLVKDSIIDILNNNNTFKNIAITFKVKAKDNIEDILKVNDKNVYFLNDLKPNLEYFPSGECVYKNYWGEETSMGKVINCTTTVNLVRISLIANNKDEFFTILNETMDTIQNELMQGFELIGNKNKNHFNYLFNKEIFPNIDLDEGQKIRKIIKNGTLQIGFIGLYESVIALNKGFDIKLANKVLTFMADKCHSYTQNNKLNFTLVPINCPKTLQYFLRIDRSIYGNLKNITDKEKYTNYPDIIEYKDINYEYLNMFNNYVSGYLVKIKINKGLSVKKENEIIQELLTNKIPFFKLINTKDDKV